MDAAEAGISRSAPIRSEPVQVDKSRSFDVTALAAAAGRAALHISCSRHLEDNQPSRAALHISFSRHLEDNQPSSPSTMVLAQTGAS